MTSSRHALATLVALATATPSLAAPQADFALRSVEHGFGQLLPHLIPVPDGSGNPTAQVVPVLELEDLIENVTPLNGVLPTPTWPTAAQLPNGLGGNQFVAVRFNRSLDVDSVLDADPAATVDGQLTGALTVVGVNSLTGQALPIQGRAFVGGATYAGTPVGNPPQLPLQTWFTEQGGTLSAVPGVDNDQNGVPDGLGFPGTEPGTHFAGATGLDDANVFVFVPDVDGDLATHEAFPTGFEIVVEVSASVRSSSAEPLTVPARISSTAGPDSLAPELRLLPGPPVQPDLVPANGELNVDPATTVTVGFTEAVQPGGFGNLTGGGAPLPGSPISLTFGPVNQTTVVPYTALPVSAFDLSTVVLTPAYPFPGKSSVGLSNCGSYNQVLFQLTPGQVPDLANNLNLLQGSSFFVTGEGPGLVNAPVAPDAIYAGLRDTLSSLSVIDLNGFGGSTGNPTYDPLNPATEGNSNFPNNPNVQLQGSMLRPPLSLGQCTTDGGSAGVFTRTLDSNLDPRLARSPVLLDVGDMALGRALDTTFNGAPAPFGCQAGGGNLCAIDGLQLVNVTLGGPNTLRPAEPTDPLLNSGTGPGNAISWAPHPNPPPLVYPPLCVSPYLGGQEPTAFDSTALLGLINLLVPGDPFGNPGLGIPPSGLLNTEQSAWFQGPSLPAQSLAQCSPYMIRQQVGQFLYAVDRARREVVVLNSNRMLPLDRISLADPTALALSPNLDLLAVTNHATDTVSFIDVNPSSSSFHQVVQETQVGAGPRGIAWDSFNEDILVCNELESSVSVLSAFSLNVRKVVTHPNLNGPFDVVITPRQTTFGAQRNVYYGYVLARDGRVSVFESGPDGVNGWGYDDLIGQARYLFRRPKAIQVDVTDLRSGVWIAHEGPIDVSNGQAGAAGIGAVSRLHAEAGLFGVLPLPPNTRPQFRELEMVVDVSLGPGVVTGVPVDLALDDQRNLGALPNIATPFSAGLPVQWNGKSLVRDVGQPVPAKTPAHLFVAVPESAGTGGAVDVVALSNLARVDTNAYQAGVQSIPMPGVRVLMDYFRQ